MTNQKYKRKITGPERYFMRSPYAAVTVVARIKGKLNKEMLKKAILKVQQKHTLLRVRIEIDENHIPWFVSEGVEEILIEEVSRQSPDQWISEFTELNKIPFEFEKRPAIRFKLVSSPEISELVINCHHIICDGMSLAYLARDIMEHLGDPSKEVEILPNPEPVKNENIPDDVVMKGIVKKVLNNINEKWELEKVYFDEVDYLELTKAYWNKFNHRAISIELSKEQTTQMVEKCRNEKITVNSAIIAAFSGAQSILQDKESYNNEVAVASDVRNRIKVPTGECMGFYAGGFSVKNKYNQKKGFWENARKLHKKIQSNAINKNIFDQFLVFSNIDMAIFETRNYKSLGDLVPKDSPRYDKIYSFSQKEDMVKRLLKRNKVDSYKDILAGTAITNLTNLKFPENYGPLELERLMFYAGGAFPLVTIPLVLGVVTTSGRMSIMLEYAEEAVPTELMENIKTKAAEFLEIA
ncbi:MAG: hypothetical protein GY870_13670 [archaeon]|nr:hypothetical protein [archaeon]